MKKSILALVATLALGCDPGPAPDAVENTPGAIHNGTVASNSHRSGVVKVRFRLDDGRQALCSGTIYSNRWVVTNSHCIFTPDPSRVTIENAPGAGGLATTFGADLLIKHPQAMWGQATALDLALVRISGAFSTQYILKDMWSAHGKLHLDRSTLANLNNMQLRSEGYGEDGSPGTSGTLRFGDLRVFSAQTNTLDLVETASQSGGLCGGDSGGPAWRRLFEIGRPVHYMLAGIMRAGICGDTTWAVPVTTVAPWIIDTVNAN